MRKLPLKIIGVLSFTKGLSDGRSTILSGLFFVFVFTLRRQLDVFGEQTERVSALQVPSAYLSLGLVRLSLSANPAFDEPNRRKTLESFEDGEVETATRG